MFSFAKYLHDIVKFAEQEPSTTALEGLVTETVEKTKGKASDANTKSQWELLLREEVFKIVATEGAALKDQNSKYYDQLRLRLDITLVFTEQKVVEAAFTFNILEEILDTQTIASCSEIFTWIEQRADRLTAGMVPNMGKSLVLLRTLNDLLRRLSKTGNATTFCGRILIFLSGVFPLGERSGVNLRGEYGPQWEDVEWRPLRAKTEDKDRMEVDEEEKSKAVETKAVVEEKSLVAKKEEDKKDGEDVQMEGVEQKGGEKKDEPLAQPEKSPDEKRQDFYQLFWSLQRPFSRPPMFGQQPTTMSEFKKAVDGVLPVLREANAKERIMSGSKTATGGAGTKRKRDAADPPEDTTAQNYFFAKFLTSPDLLDLEIADTNFRRQVLFQMLVLLSHLQSFTKDAKAKWESPRNRSLQMAFTLEADDEKWVQESINKAYEELRQTSPGGRAFADTVATILEREKNWIKWKTDLCPPFDKEPLKESLWDATAEKRAKMREDPPEWKHRYGSEKITELWEFGYRDPRDLENFTPPEELRNWVNLYTREDRKIELRKKQLAQLRAQAVGKDASAPAPPVPSQPPPAKDAMVVDPSPSEKPKSTSTNGPLHPSLPPKPGSTSTPAAPTPTPTAPAAAAPPKAPPTKPAAPPDKMIAKFDEAKQTINWLGIRSSRDTHLRFFGRIGNGDVLLLQQEVDKEEEMLAQKAEAEAAAARQGLSAPPEDERGTSLGGGGTPAPPEDSKLGLKDKSAAAAASGDHDLSMDSAGAASDGDKEMKMETDTSGSREGLGAAHSRSRSEGEVLEPSTSAQPGMEVDAT